MCLCFLRRLVRPPHARGQHNGDYCAEELKTDRDAQACRVGGVLGREERTAEQSTCTAESEHRCTRDGAF